MSGRELQATRGRRVESRNFAHDRSEAAFPKAVFHEPEKVTPRARFGDDKAIWIEPDRSEPWCKEVRAVRAPENRPFKPREDARQEQRRRRAEAFVIMIASDIVKRAERQPSIRQMPVESEQPERQGSGRTPSLSTFDYTNALT